MVRRVNRGGRQEFHRRTQNALRAVAEELDLKLHEVIQTPRFWAGFEGSTTYRANGSIVVGAFRNIEDLGNLDSSQSYTVGNKSFTFTWDGNGITPVTSVFFGHRTSTSYVPGRDWVTPAIVELNIPLTFKQKF